MTVRVQSLCVLVMIAVLVSAGCTPSDSDGGILAPVPPDQRRANLLRQLERKFENPKAHSELGRFYLEQGRLDDAEFHYKTALSFDPMFWAARAGIVKVLEAKGLAAEAKQTAELYINEVGASAGRSLRLGRAFQNQQLDGYALACYQQALRLEPDSPEVYKQLGYFYLGRDDKVRAQEYFRRSFELDWNQPDVAYELGRMGTRIEVQGKSEPLSDARAGRSETKAEK